MVDYSQKREIWFKIYAIVEGGHQRVFPTAVGDYYKIFTDCFKSHFKIISPTGFLPIYEYGIRDPSGTTPITYPGLLNPTSIPINFNEIPNLEIMRSE